MRGAAQAKYRTLGREVSIFDLLPIFRPPLATLSLRISDFPIGRVDFA